MRVWEKFIVTLLVAIVLALIFHAVLKSHAIKKMILQTQERQESSPD